MDRLEQVPDKLLVHVHRILDCRFRRRHFSLVASLDVEDDLDENADDPVQRESDVKCTTLHLQ